MMLTLSLHKEWEMSMSAKLIAAVLVLISGCEGTLIAEEHEQFTFSTGAGISTPL